MIGDILPPEVAAEEAFDDRMDTVLFPEEEEVIAKAVGKRRREFTTARACARDALGRLGLPPVPIVPGHRGAPQWPAGVVGSITHCEGYRACAVARASEIVTIGLDAEPHAPLPGGVLDAAALAGARPDVHWDRMLFCVKESVYKAWFPLTGRWLGFEDACVDFEPDAATFDARLMVPGPVVNGKPLTGFTGRYLVSRGLIVTAIVIANERWP
jgi:4'-phosphopantetheinyl transferase EntD